MKQLLASIIVLILSSAFLHGKPYEDRALGILFSIVYITGLLAVGGNRQTLIKGSIFLIPVLIARWCDEFSPGFIPERFIAILALLLMAYVISHLFRFIIRAPHVNREVLYAGISIYLLTALVWAVAYLFISEISPGSFFVSTFPDAKLDFHSALYFSFITLATVGYGDIVPKLPMARTFALAEAVAGCLYMAILIARLVAQYSTEKSIISENKE